MLLHKDVSVDSKEQRNYLQVKEWKIEELVNVLETKAVSHGGFGVAYLSGFTSSEKINQ